jgi:hypothetical protein
MVGAVYLEVCNDADVTPAIDPKSFISIGQEANGNTILCHKETGEVFLYLCDEYSYETFTEPYDVEETIFKYRECVDFRSWVETIAIQWTL